MIYKNMSHATKTFYGVTFRPGEAHEVTGHINHPDMIIASDSDVVQNPKPVKKSNTSAKSNVKEGVKSDGSDND